MRRKDTYRQEPESVFFFMVANRELNVEAFFELGKKYLKDFWQCAVRGTKTAGPRA